MQGALVRDYRNSVFICLFALCFQPALAQQACVSEPFETIQITHVNERLELELADGRTLRLMGIEPPFDTDSLPHHVRDAQAALQSVVDTHTVVIGGHAQNVDRWGRLSVQAAIAQTPPLSLAFALIDAGWVRYAPDGLMRDCRNAMLAAENTARNARYGLWKDPANAIISASDSSSLHAQIYAPRFTIIEGRVLNVGQTATRLYLNFGARRTIDFSASILNKNRKVFEKEGLFFQQFSGKMIRLRGQVDGLFGLNMQITTPEAIEIVP
jgi:endonuclease YncB( thermonuclease family)